MTAVWIAERIIKHRKRGLPVLLRTYSGEFCRDAGIDENLFLGHDKAFWRNAADKIVKLSEKKRMSTGQGI